MNARLAIRFGEKIIPMSRAYPREQGVHSERELILEDARSTREARSAVNH